MKRTALLGLALAIRHASLVIDLAAVAAFVIVLGAAWIGSCP